MSSPPSSKDSSSPVFEETATPGGRPRRGPRVPRRPRWGLVLAAVAVIAVAGGGNAWLAGHLDHRQPMVVLTHDIGWGQRVTQADVTTVDLSPEARRVGIAQSEWNHTLHDQRAAVPLRAGQLLSRSALTHQTVPGPGQQVVGLRLTAGHYPADGLAPNDPVQVIPVNPQAASDPTTGAPAVGAGFSARVVRTAGPDPDGALTVDVLVDQSRAPDASNAAATGALVTLLGPTR